MINVMILRRTMEFEIRERSLKITFFGTVPSKKNSKRICRDRLIASKAHMEFKNLRLPLLKAYKTKLDNAPYYKATIKMLVYPDSKRKADLSNKLETLMDLCVDAEILKDDNWFICSKVYMAMIEVDRKNPRIEFIIEV